MKGYTALLLVGIFLALCGLYYSNRGNTSTPHTAETAQNLALRVTSQIEATEDKKIPLPAWLESKAHFMLSRYYFTKGKNAEAEGHLQKVSAIRDRRILVRPYFDRFLVAVQNGDTQQVIKLIQNAEDAARWINSVQYVRDLYDPEFETSTGQSIPSHWIQSQYCEFAGKIFSGKRQYALLDQIAAIDECQSKRIPILRYKIAARAKDKNFKQAYVETVSALLPLFKPTADPLPSTVTLLEACAPAIDDESPNQPDTANAFFQTRPSSEQDAVLKAAFLRITNKPDDAFKVLMDYGATDKTKAAMLPLYEEYYLKNNRDKTSQALAFMETLTKPAKLTGGFGTKHPHQWWVSVISEGNIIAKHPSPLGYEIALSLKDGKARFSLMKEVFNHSKTHKSGDFPGCAKQPGVCIVDELEKIADHESDAWDRDTMHGFLSEMARLLGDQPRSALFKSKIINLNRTQCAYDMCEAGTIRSMQYAEDRPVYKRDDFMDRLLGDNFDFKLPEDRKKPSYALDRKDVRQLAKDLQALSDTMNDIHADYKAVSTQSGYNVGYLDDDTRQRVDGEYKDVCIIE